MVNILSVDFDWIMAPSIDLYNGAACDNINVEDSCPATLNVTLRPDYNKYKQLGIYLKNITDKIGEKSKIVFADKHRSLITCINDKWKLDVPLHVYNIDHHHDCGYEMSIEDCMKTGIDSGNWAIGCDKIKKYTWIGNNNSETITITDEKINKFGEFTMVYDINAINYINFDYVFVCLSPGWIPKELWPLYELLEFNIKHEVISL